MLQGFSKTLKKGSLNKLSPARKKFKKTKKRYNIGRAKNAAN
jgi:hypothetical protein